jgi:hypothetical protein
MYTARTAPGFVRQARKSTVQYSKIMVPIADDL